MLTSVISVPWSKNFALSRSTNLLSITLLDRCTLCCFKSRCALLTSLNSLVLLSLCPRPEITWKYCLKRLKLLFCWKSSARNATAYDFGTFPFTASSYASAGVFSSAMRVREVLGRYINPCLPNFDNPLTLPLDVYFLRPVRLPYNSVLDGH